MPLNNKIAYIAGPITGHEETYEQTFAEAESKLKGMGATVLNPSLLPLGLRSHKSYMNICIPMLLEADVVIMLPGWEQSKGAKIEYIEAMSKDMPVFLLSQFVEL